MFSRAPSFHWDLHREFEKILPSSPITGTQLKRLKEPKVVAMKRRCLLTAAIALFTACAGDAQFVLHEPVAQRCENSDLRDCDTLTRATLLYADGKAADARRSLLSALDANADKPAELQQFADGLEKISVASNGGAFRENLEPAIALVRNVAGLEAARNAANSRPTLDLGNPTQAYAPKPALIATSTLPSAAHSQLQPSEPPSSSVFFMLAGNALASECRFPGAPKMLCLHESVETARVVSDIIVSAACPYEVLFASRHGIDLDWVTYAPAGNGAEVHGAALPLIPGHTLTAGVSYNSEVVSPDVRCGITVVWRDTETPRVPAPPRQTRLD